MGHSQTRSFPAASQTVWQALLLAVEKAGWKIADSQENNCLEVRTGISALCLLGLNIKIALTQTGQLMTEVAVQASARGQLLDYGLPDKETQRLFTLLEEELAANCSAPGSFAANVCAACGAPTKPGANFCAACGAPATQVAPSVPVCTQCRAPVKPGTKFCAGCGAPVAQAVPPLPMCVRCGAPTKPGAKFCAACGHSL